ncbi:MAG: PsiF family protein [Zoogloeaceae bacterium]|nr:PsiF family protein [Zoogloeaceae bacterium]
MKHLMLVVAAVFSLSVSPLFAADDADVKPKKEPSAAQKAQREKMSTCSKEAKSQGLKGEERKTFMRGCLSASGGAPKTARVENTDQEKTAKCKAEAKEKKLKGDERRAFIAGCVAE